MRIILTLILSGPAAKAGDFARVLDMAHANGFDPKPRIVYAITAACRTYNIDCLDLAAIGILESGLGKYESAHVNNNGSIDIGIFQINTVNYPHCSEFNLRTPEGSAMCAAKLLHRLRKTRGDSYVEVYHSKTPSKRAVYREKINRVIAMGEL